MNKYLKKIGYTNCISSWESKGFSDEVFKPPINNDSLAAELEYVSEKMFAKFEESCLIEQDEFIFNKKTVNIYIIYDLESNLINCDPTLENCLFGAIKITKNSDMNKYKYSGY